MEIIKDGLWLCSDCTYVACNGSHGTDLSANDLAIVVMGVSELGPHLVPDFDSETSEGLREFSAHQCDSCLSTLTGYRARFALLGDTPS